MGTPTAEPSNFAAGPHALGAKKVDLGWFMRFRPLFCRSLLIYALSDTFSGALWIDKLLCAEAEGGALITTASSQPSCSKDPSTPRRPTRKER